MYAPKLLNSPVKELLKCCFMNANQTKFPVAKLWIKYDEFNSLQLCSVITITNGLLEDRESPQNEKTSDRTYYSADKGYVSEIGNDCLVMCD